METGIDGRVAAPESSAQIRNTLGLLPVIALSAALTGPAYAQTATPAPGNAGAADSDVVLEQVNVQGKGSAVTNKNEAKPGVKRLPTKVQDTPQVINVITQEDFEQRAVTSLSEVITRTPGVTMSAGEGGGGGMSGDSFNIRGFSAIGNIFVDGIRDSGVYSRDTFNLEQVEVFKGGAGSTLGRGGGGGSINMTSKTAKDHFFADIFTTIGTDSYYRGAIDVNVPVSPEVAFRLNAVGLSRDFAERDFADLKRWGIAPTVTFGMTTNTSLTLSFIHQQDEGRPDNGVPRFGIPIASGGDGINRPVTTQGVRRQNYYGYKEDHEEYRTDLFTASLKHDFSNNLSVTNTTRIGAYDTDRFVSTMPASGLYSGTCPTPTAATCFITPGLSTRGMRGNTYHNQTTLNASFNTGTLEHEALVGLDLSRENLHHLSYALTPPISGGGAVALPPISLTNPTLVSHGRTRALSGDVKHVADTIGIMAYDRVHFGNGFYGIGNVRYEKFKVDGENLFTGQTAKFDQDLFSWQTALEYKPWENHTYYASISNTQLPRSPTTGYVTGGTGLIDADVVDADQTTAYEVGGKWSVLDGRLGLGASAFYLKRKNEVTLDGDGNQVVNNDNRKIKGIELSASGHVTSALTISAGYTYLHGRVDNPGGTNDGYVIGLMPEHSGFVWADYEFNEKFKVGAGANFSSFRYTGDYSPVTKEGGRLPGHVTWDAAASYKFNDHFSLQFNAINIFNKLYFEKSHGARHMMPGQGRTFLLTAKTSF